MKIELDATELIFLRKYLKSKIENIDWILDNKLDTIKDKMTLEDNLIIMKSLHKKLENIKINMNDTETFGGKK